MSLFDHEAFAGAGMGDAQVEGVKGEPAHQRALGFLFACAEVAQFDLVRSIEKVMMGPVLRGQFLKVLMHPVQ